MKTNIIKAILGCGALTLLTACGDNSWNNHLDGFVDDPAYVDVQSLDYTMTDADYARLADNRFNKAKAAAADLSKELALVKTQKYFNPAIDPMEYVPNLLKDSLFKYYTLTEGSAINLTYRIATELPEEIKTLTNAEQYVMDETDYQYVYGSETDYTASFSPICKASTGIPKVLADRFDDAEAGTVVVINYNNSDVEPVFTQTSEPPTPSFTLSDVIGGVAVGDAVDISGVVTAKCVRGFILTDNSGSILVYSGNFDYAAYEVGDQLAVSATITSYGNGLQIAFDSATIEKKGTQSYTYPSPIDLSISYLAAAGANTNPVTAVYGKMNGTVNISGNYININMDSEEVRGSVYYASDELKGLLPDGAKVTLYGYFTSTSGKGNPYNCNLVVTKVEQNTKGARKAPRKVVSVPSVNLNAVYQFDGSRWSEVKSAAVLQPADYIAMGQTYGNLSATAAPSFYLPIYLKTNFPYAQAGDSKFVMYKYYDSTTKLTNYMCDQYKYDGNAWILNDGVKEETAQYVYGPDGWVMDPSITVTLPAGKSQPLSTKFFQACVDWVKDNVPDGSEYISSYGNNEYYCGTSAYQGNIDLRPSAARTQYAGYDSMTDDEIVALMKKRFETEVMPGALSVLYPNLDVTPGVTTLFTINFAVYTGSTAEYTIVFKVVGKGKFEFVSCDW